MRTPWIRSKAAPMPEANRPQFIMWDFLRMFLAAIACGLAVSLAVASITLVLANDAYAAASPNGSAMAISGNAELAPNAEPEAQPYPGLLMLGNGCDADPLDATERDWLVTIRGDHIDIRVMQTFIVPDGDTAAATFNALLPTGAKLLRLSAHSSGNSWQGKIFDAKSHAQLTAIDFRNLSRKGMLIVENDDGAISTDAIINIAATEAVTIEYTYRITTAETQGVHNLFVALSSDKSLLSQTTDNLTANGTVWVQWLDKNPGRLTRVPSGATLEATGTKITGLSWTTNQFNADATFQLAWSM